MTNPFLVRRDRPRKPDGIYGEIVSEQTFCSVLVCTLILVKQPNQYELREILLCERNRGTVFRRRRRFLLSGFHFFAFSLLLLLRAFFYLMRERRGVYLTRGVSFRLHYFSFTSNSFQHYFSASASLNFFRLPRFFPVSASTKFRLPSLFHSAPIFLLSFSHSRLERLAKSCARPVKWTKLILRPHNFPPKKFIISLPRISEIRRNFLISAMRHSFIHFYRVV